MPPECALPWMVLTDQLQGAAPAACVQCEVRAAPSLAAAFVACAMRHCSVSPPGAGYTKFVKVASGTLAHVFMHSSSVANVPEQMFIIRVQ